MKCLFSFFLFLVSIQFAAAQLVEPDSLYLFKEVEELDGLILDQTRTRIGRDFFDKFFSLWIAPEGVSEYTVIVEEQPSRNRLGYVEIKVDDAVVASYNLQPRESWMEEAATNAVERLTNHLENLSQTQKELDSGDQAGSGIY